MAGVLQGLFGGDSPSPSPVPGNGNNGDDAGMYQSLFVSTCLMGYFLCDVFSICPIFLLARSWCRDSNPQQGRR